MRFNSKAIILNSKTTLNMKNLLLLFTILGLATAATGQISAIDLYRTNSPIDQRYYGEGSIKTLITADNNLRQGQLESAILAYDMVVAQWPTWAPAYVKRAVAKMRMGRRTEAEQDLAKAYQISSNSVQLFSERNPGGKLSLLATELEDSPADWQEILRQLHPLKRQGNLTQATTEIAALYATNWLNEEEMALLQGNVNFLRDDYLTAIAYYDWILSRGTQAPLLHNRGLAQILSYNFADGCADLLQAGTMGHLPSLEQHADLCSF